MLEARGLFRSAICFRSILSRQNGLNRHMEQKTQLAENQVFQLFGLQDPYRTPIGPLSGRHCIRYPKTLGWGGVVLQCRVDGAFADTCRHIMSLLDICKLTIGFFHCFFLFFHCFLLFFIDVHRVLWFFLQISSFFQRTGFQRTGNRWIFIDRHPSMNSFMDIHQ